MRERTPVYVISVAARLLDVHPQTLRNYERAGFLRPTRTEGRRRLYSVEDIEELRSLIGTVEQFGLNLTGLPSCYDQPRTSWKAKTHGIRGWLRWSCSNRVPRRHR